ncbi:hypothetical protein ACWV95_20195 [Streptomyces albus]
MSLVNAPGGPEPRWARHAPRERAAVEEEQARLVRPFWRQGPGGGFAAVYRDAAYDPFAFEREAGRTLARSERVLRAARWAGLRVGGHLPGSGPSEALEGADATLLDDASAVRRATVPELVEALAAVLLPEPAPAHPPLSVRDAGNPELFAERGIPYGRAAGCRSTSWRRTGTSPAWTAPNCAASSWR